ncbi:hypothetical protein [Nocardioides luteus]|uniref:hypothetical protein n=1 Tax=Nocardioides luteus TaxID=1844 RepID=UPI000A5A5036|nr:hypothetical protein [Nocardioides luteus]
MSAAIISGLFAVVLACLAWGLQNGSRRARLLSRIERYTQILKDLPYGHPARAHLDAALAAEAAQLRDLIGSSAPPFPAPGYPPSYAPAPLPYAPYGPPDLGPATMDDIFGTGDAPRPGSPSTPPSPRPAGPAPGPTPAPTPGGPAPAPSPGPTPAPAPAPDPAPAPGPAPSPAPGPAPMPAPATKPRLTPPMREPARSSRSLQTYASLALGLLAGGFAIFAIWLAVDQLLR